VTVKAWEDNVLPIRGIEASGVIFEVSKCHLAVAWYDAREREKTHDEAVTYNLTLSKKMSPLD
jgi:hypothetical protein